MEDALRIIRAVRFCATLSFKLEDETKKAIRLNSALVKNISIERVRDEIEKILLSKSPHEILKLHNLGIACHISQKLDDILMNFKNVTALKNSVNDIVHKFCILFYEYGEETAINILKLLKYDNKTIIKTRVLLKNINSIKNADKIEIVP